MYTKVIVIIFICIFTLNRYCLAQTLYGKIEMLESKQGDKLDVLDNNVANDKQSNTVISYPIEFKGKWHGRLVVSSISLSKEFITRDQNEANLYNQYCKQGSYGSVNLDFKMKKNEIIYLEPAKILFTVLNPKIEAFELNFGDIHHGQSLGHNLIKSQVLKNEINKLDENCYEQNILTKEYTKIKSSNNEYFDYSQSVIRITKINNDNNLKIVIACISYDNNGNYLIKTFLEGLLYKGHYSIFDKIKASINN